MPSQVYRIICFPLDFCLVFCLNIFTTQCCMFAGVLIEDAVFLAADAAASSFPLGSCTACFSTGSSVLLLLCEFTFLWSILLRLQMGYSFATCISWFASASGFHLCSARLCFTCPALLFSPIFTFLADFTSCGAMSHRVLTSWVVCDMLHLLFRSVFAT